MVDVSGHRRNRAIILGCPLDAVSMRAAVALVDGAVRERRTLLHGALNAAKVVAAGKNDALRRALMHCDLVTADGQSVVWAARLLGYPVPERVAGIDLMEELLALAEQHGYRIFFLGAREEVLDAAVAALRVRFPRLEIAGWHHGYFSDSEGDEVVAEIAGAEPDMLFVAMETPTKELFLGRNVQQLGPIFAMGIGGAVDVLAGVRQRAPRSLQRLGLEWLYRFLQDPRRLARRYLIGNLAFLRLLVLELAARWSCRGERATMTRRPQ
jgi:N-acetylglucosaminyldiphosphoundecaprenol N-acetyl-beta-D-mannosaminyltransferase